MIGGSYKTGSVAVTDGAVANNTTELGFTLYDHFNILTQTLTNVTVTIEGTLDDTNWVDVTNDLFGVANLSANSEYLADTYMTYKNLRIRYNITNATNSVNFQWMVKKGGGR